MGVVMHRAHRSDVEAVEKLTKFADVIERLRGGQTPAEIADVYGVTAQTIRHWRIRAHEEAQRELDMSTDGYRLAQVNRREELIEAFWPRAMEGDLAAANFVRTMFTELERLLGLDKASEKDKVGQVTYVLNLPGSAPAQLQDGNTVEGEIEVVRE